MITKQNIRFRESVPAEMKLAIPLRYLATGDSVMSLMYLIKVSKQFNIINATRGSKSYN
jgi:hypothetical protein